MFQQPRAPRNLMCASKLHVDSNGGDETEIEEDTPVETLPRSSTQQKHSQEETCQPPMTTVRTETMLTDIIAEEEKRGTTLEIVERVRDGSADSACCRVDRQTTECWNISAAQPTIVGTLFMEREESLGAQQEIISGNVMLRDEINHPEFDRELTLEMGIMSAPDALANDSTLAVVDEACLAVPKAAASSTLQLALSQQFTPTLVLRDNVIDQPRPASDDHDPVPSSELVATNAFTPTLLYGDVVAEQIEQNDFCAQESGAATSVEPNAVNLSLVQCNSGSVKKPLAVEEAHVAHDSLTIPMTPMRLEGEQHIVLNGVTAPLASTDTQSALILVEGQLERATAGRRSLKSSQSTLPSHGRGVAFPPQRKGTSEIRALIGHTLRPMEQGKKVTVQGDGWGGGRGKFLATITEADCQTFTVIREWDSGAWEETHVLRALCQLQTDTAMSKRRRVL